MSYLQILVDGVITNQAEIGIWTNRDVSCRNIFFATIEADQKRCLYGLSTAKQMWDLITTQYAAKAEDQEHNLHQALYNFKFDKGIYTSFYH